MLELNHPLILASGSRARKEMLSNVGLKFDTIPADIDEDTILKAMQADKSAPAEIALELGRQKALSISAKNPNAFVIGSDQILECEGALFQKANTVGEAREKLKTLRGKTHHLVSSAAIAHNNKIIWETRDTAKLTMHDISDSHLEEYLAAATEDITSCVGAYAFENHGAWLFESTDANYFTILGMPLLPLLKFLREQE